MVKFDQTYRKEVNITQPYIQGETEDEVRRKYHLDKVVKLGSNENPYAPYYHSKNAMIHSISTLNRYPEDDFVNMKKLLADETGLKPENVALGSGAGNIIETISKFPGVSASTSIFSMSAEETVVCEISRALLVAVKAKCTVA